MAIEIITEIITGLALCALAIGNIAAISRSHKRRSTICERHNRRIMLGMDSDRANLSNDLFVDKGVLKMHNTGTHLEVETDVLDFVSIAKESDYFGKLRIY